MGFLDRLQQLKQKVRKSKSFSSAPGSSLTLSNSLSPPSVGTRPVSSGGQIFSTSSTQVTVPTPSGPISSRGQTLSASSTQAIVLTPPRPVSSKGQTLITASTQVPAPTPPGPLSITVPQQTVSPRFTQTKTLWEKAVDQLPEEDRNIFSFANPDKRDTLLEVIQATKEKRNQCVEKQWRYKRQNGEEVVLREVVDGLLVRLNKYAIIGDTAIQHNPDIVALAWAGFRFLLQISLNDTETMANVLAALEYITHILSRCAIYECLYIKNTIQLASAQNFAGSLQDLYGSILKYLSSSKRYFSQNTAERIASGILNPYITTFQPLIDDLKDQESRTEKDARVAAEEFQHTVALGAVEQSSDQQNQTRELSQMLGEMRQPIIHIEAKVTEIHESFQDAERLKILKWLSTITYQDHHSFISSTRLPGTGKWLPQKPEFINWIKDGSSSILWLHGIAGAGKTKLASFVVDTIKNTSSNNDALLYFYCNYKEDERRDPESILRALVKQISAMRPSLPLPKPVSELYREREKKGFESGPLTLEESKNLIMKLTAEFRQTVICIDALDECNKTTRDKLLHALEQILRSSTSLVKIFVTSRDDDDIVLHLDGSPNVYIKPDDNSGDIGCFVTAEVERCISEKKILRGGVSTELKERIIGTIISGAYGMFLWAHLQIMSICKEKTAPTLEKALTRLPTDLKDMFSEIWRRIQDQSDDSKLLAKRALKLILFAQRPLSRAEILEALSVNPQERIVQLIDGLTEMTVLDVCQNLVVVDEELGVLRFAHFSVQEFLRDLFEAPKAHHEIAEICLTLLCFSEKRGRWGKKHYVDHYWEKHLSLSCDESESLMELQRVFLQPSIAFDCWCFRKYIHEDDSPLKEMPHELIKTPLMIACEFGLVNAFRHLLSTCIDPNTLSPLKETALHFAACFGHSTIVNDLLGREDIRADTQDNRGRTPLFRAAGNGHKGVVKLLLAVEGIEINSRDKYSQTPLSLAAGNGHEGVVKLLLVVEGIDINSRDKYSQTPLSLAAANGHEGVVKLLLAVEGIDIESKDDDSQIPLSLAAGNGHEGVVKLLLAVEGIDIESKDDDSQTSLSLAAGNGYEGVVKLLLAVEGIDIESKDDDSQTSLSLAAGNGHEGVVKLLLAVEGIDINSRDKHSRTPLSWAAENGHEGVVKLLLAVEGIDINPRDKYGQTPLLWAATDGNEKVVVQLLAKGDIHVDSNDNEGQTPLFGAAHFGHKKIVKHLLASKKVDVNHKDKSGRTPLYTAVKWGYSEIIEMLLAVEGIDFDIRSEEGLALLSKAEERGDKEIVRMLREKAMEIQASEVTTDEDN